MERDNINLNSVVNESKMKIEEIERELRAIQEKYTFKAGSTWEEMIQLSHSNWLERRLFLRKHTEKLETIVHKIQHSSDESERRLHVEMYFSHTSEEAFTLAQSLASSSSRELRIIATDLLAGLKRDDNPESPPAIENMYLLLEMLSKETDTEIIMYIGKALGCFDNSDKVPALSKLRNHPSSDVRFGVVMGLLADTTIEAVEAMVELSRDPDDDTRNWATHGLGTQLMYDKSESVISALQERLSDSVDEIRGEALLGLAYRRTPDALSAIKNELQAKSINDLVFEAAEELADESLCPLLKKWLDYVSDSEGIKAINDAITACSNQQ